MKKYKIEKFGSLLFTRCAIKGKDGIIILKILVDTGSTYTILPWEALETIGYSPSESKNKARIVTGSGIIIAPRLSVEYLSAFGKKITNFGVVAHTLPLETYTKGILGMDFLTKVKAIIDTEKGIIQVK